jgi:hypothetical protein
VPNFASEDATQAGNAKAIDFDNPAVDIAMHRSLEVVPVFIGIGVVIPPNPMNLYAAIENSLDAVLKRNRRLDVAQKDHGSWRLLRGGQCLFDMIEMGVDVTEEPDHENLDSKKANRSPRASISA